MKVRSRIAGGLATLVLAAACGSAFSQNAAAPPRSAADRAPVVTTYVSFGQLGQGLLWSPAVRGKDARTAIVLVHPHASSLGNPLCAGLAERGFVVLCADPNSANRVQRFGGYDAQAQTIAAALTRAREEAGVGALVLAGHGEGGALAAFYQNVAVNGPSACYGPEKLAPCDAGRLSGLPPADKLLLIDPDLGQAFAALSALDPAITEETAPARRAPALDMYAPQNGFDPGRNAATYPAAFRKAFHAAQAERGARLVDQARKLVSAAATREQGAFGDDMPLFVAGAAMTPLWQVDYRLLARTKRPHKLLAGDGSTPARVLRAIASPTGNPREAASFRSAIAYSARQYLSGYAIEAGPDFDVTDVEITGVNWGSSATSAIPNMAGVKAPLLVLANTAHAGVRQAEMIFDAAAAQDKELVGVEGGVHALTPCTTCAAAPGRRFGDTLSRSLDYIAQWLRQRSQTEPTRG